MTMRSVAAKVLRQFEQRSSEAADRCKKDLWPRRLHRFREVAALAAPQASPALRGGCGELFECGAADKLRSRAAVPVATLRPPWNLLKQDQLSEGYTPLGGEVIPVNMRNAAEIEQSVSFALSPNGGLIPASSAAALRYRDLIVTLAARHRLPAVCWDGFFVAAGA